MRGQFSEPAKLSIQTFQSVIRTSLYPDLSPDRFGHYLQTAWQIVRAEQMFEPWYMADKDQAILKLIKRRWPRNHSRKNIVT